MMIVFVGGMQRSGSTFCFNVVRKILSARGSVHCEANVSITPVVIRSGFSDSIIMKGHDADEVTVRLIQSGAVKSVCSVRKPEDAIASWMTIFGFSIEKSIEDMILWLDMFEKIRSYSLILKYDQIDKNPKIAARKIHRHIDGGIDFLRSARIAEEFSKKTIHRKYEKFSYESEYAEDLGFSFHNKVTFFHRNHVSSIVSMTAEDILSGPEINLIRYSLRHYTDDHDDVL